MAYFFYVALGIGIGVVATLLVHRNFGGPVTFVASGLIMYSASLFSHYRFAYGVSSWPALERNSILRTMAWVLVVLFVGRIMVAMVGGAWLQALNGYDDGTHLNPVTELRWGVRYFDRNVAALVTLINGCVIAPISEELVFRSGVYRVLKGRASIVAAAGISAALFALMHRSVTAFPPCFTIGILCCWIYEKTADIRGPILFHAGYNLLVSLPVIQALG